MGWIKKEVKAFGKEAMRQVFGNTSKSKSSKRPNKLERQFQEIKSWARRNGFNK